MILGCCLMIVGCIFDDVWMIQSRYCDIFAPKSLYFEGAKILLSQYFNSHALLSLVMSREIDAAHPAPAQGLEIAILSEERRPILVQIQLVHKLGHKPLFGFDRGDLRAVI